MVSGLLGSRADNDVRGMSGMELALEYGSSLGGYLGSTSSLWSGSAAPVTMIGPYSASSVANEAWLTPVFSYNPFTSQYVTYDNGAFSGYMGGIKRANSAWGVDALEAIITALYMDNSATPNVGILTGTMSGNAYPNTGVYRMDGSVQTVQLGQLTTSTDPSTFQGLISTAVHQISLNAALSFDGTNVGFTMGNYPMPQLDRNYISSVSSTGDWWGIWSSQICGYYDNSVALPTTGWNLEVTDTSGTMGLLVQGGAWSPNNRLSATAVGYFADMTPSQPITGVMGGNLRGVYDPATSTLNSVMTGAWLETSKFLNMAASPSGRAALQSLNIPSIQVGQADMTGSNGNTNVAMSGVTFFAYTGGQAPKVWATNSVAGNYDGTHGSVAMTSTNPAAANLYAVFQMSSPANSKWQATVTGSGTLNASYVGPVNFKGTAAGNINGSAFTGTAAGISR